MNGYGYESDELFENDESDEAYDESSDEAITFAGRKIPTRINPGRTARGTGLFRPRPTNTNKFATQAQVEAGFARVGRQIAANSDAIKKVAAQSNRINSELGAATTKLNKQVSDLKKEVKQQAETNLLLTLLSKPPALKTTPVKITYPDPANPSKSLEATVVGNIEYDKQNSMLPLVLLMSQGGLGGGDGSNSNMLFLALALSGQL